MSIQEFVFWMIAIFGITIFTVVMMYFRNHFTVDHPSRRRIVLRNVFTGTMRVLGGSETDRSPLDGRLLSDPSTNGTTYHWPWWVEDQDVELNREPQTTSETDGHLARSKDGVEFIVKARRDDLLARPFNDVNGEVLSEEIIDNAAVIRAITKLDYENRTDYIASVFSAAIDRVIGSYSADELTRPDREKPEVPQNKVPELIRDADGKPVLDAKGNKTYKWDYKPGQEKKESIATLWVGLAKEIEWQTNLGLVDVDLDVAKVKIEDMRIKDPVQQAALEQSLKNRNLARAAKDELKDTTDLTEREKFAIGTSQQGEVTKAAAAIIGSKAIAEAITVGFKTVADRFGPSTTPPTTTPPQTPPTP